MNTNKEAEWRRFIVPKKFNKLMTTYYQDQDESRTTD